MRMCKGTGGLFPKNKVKCQWESCSSLCVAPARPGKGALVAHVAHGILKHTVYKNVTTALVLRTD